MGGEICGLRTLRARKVLAFVITAAVVATQFAAVPALAASDRAKPAVSGGRDTESVPARNPARREPYASVDAARLPSATADIARLPLSFEANVGQADENVDFVARGSGYALLLRAGTALISLEGHAGVRTEGDALLADQLPSSSAVRIVPLGANPAPSVIPVDELPGKVNYFLGNDPSRWLTDVATFSRIRYGGVYPGIDLVYHGDQRHLEYDVAVSPGADPALVRFRIEGARSLEVDGVGDLVLGAGNGTLRLRRPAAFQETERGKRFVAVSYALVGADEVAFDVGAYDRELPLVIDPVLGYSTYLGGAGLDSGTATAVDGAGNIFIGGFTSSTAFPTAGAFQSTFGGATDGFVVKLNAAGTALVYSTFLGGTADDDVRGLAIDASGNAYVTGRTQSTNFPTTVGAFQTKSGGFIDAFVTKLNAAGNALVYSTYFGGADVDEGDAIAIDGSGNAYVTGFTSLTIPTTTGAFQTAPAGGGDAFVIKLNATGSGLVYSTYLGGAPSCSPGPTCNLASTGDGSDIGRAIAVDASGNAYVAGRTGSPTFPTTTGALQTTHGSCAGCDVSGFYDAFVTKLNPTGTGLVYSTFLGGQRFDEAFGIAVDASGNAYVAGNTASLTGNFPTTNGFQTSYHLGLDAFLTKLNAAGNGVLYSTYFGGSDHDEGRAVAVSGSGIAYLAGFTVSSTDFPTRVPIQPSYGGGVAGSFFGDGFVAKFDTTRSGNASLIYSTYLGGSGQDGVSAVAVGSGGPVLTGFTSSTNFPTANPFQAANAGGFDAFVARLAETCVLAPTGLVGWWPGDGNANDIVAGDTASAFGGVTFGAGQVAQGFTLNGIDGYVRIPDTAALKPASLSVDFWFKSDVPLDGNVLEAPLLVKLNETDDVMFVSKGYDFLYEFGALRFGLVSTSAGARNNVDFAVTIPAGTWHHVAGTYDATGQKLYFDGQLVATGVNFGPIAYPAGTTNIQLGRDLNAARGPSPFFFKGTIDEVQIASRAFTASEIQAIYSALGAGMCKAIADLAVATSASPDPAAAGALLSYTISVTNNGPSAATGVKLTDKIPASTTFDSLAGQAACSFDAVTQTVTCTIGSMPSGQTLLFTVNVKPTSAVTGTTITNSTQVTANETDPDPANNTATLKTLVLATGTVVAWGDNFHGEIGDGTTTSRLTPVSIPLAGVVEVGAGRDFSVALKFDGTVWTWGANNIGQLGDGTTVERRSPVQVQGLTNVKHIAVGGFHSVAVKRDGTVWAWGQNSSGQLGDGTTTNRSTPVQVRNATGALFMGVETVAAGDLHSLAIKTGVGGGTVWAWGDNSLGQLGDATTFQRNNPVQVAAVGSLEKVDGGFRHSLGLENGGFLWVWGLNTSGQLCDGSTTSRSTPFNVSFPSLAAVAAADSHSILLKPDGTVFACGFNAGGQLGDGTTTSSSTPVQVKSLGGVGFLTGITAIAGSDAGNFSLALRGSDGVVFGWGNNTTGQLGDGTSGNQRGTPVQTSGLAGTLAIAAGAGHSLAIAPSVTNGILRGIAQCSTKDASGNVTTTVLPFATVRLLSGTVILQTTTADINGAYVIAGLAPSSTYSVQYDGFVGAGHFVCSSDPFSTDATGGGTVPQPPATAPDPGNTSWLTALPLNSSASTSITALGQSRWYTKAIQPGQQIVVTLTNVANTGINLQLALYDDLLRIAKEVQAGTTTGAPQPAAKPAPFDAIPFDAIPFDAIPFDAIPFDAIPFDAIPFDAIPFDAIPFDAIPFDAIGVVPTSYTSAQAQGLIAVSVRPGVSNEIIVRNVGDRTGNFYIRVFGANGAFSPGRASTVSAFTLGGCTVPGTTTPLPLQRPQAGWADAQKPLSTPKTIILFNPARTRKDDGSLLTDAVNVNGLATLRGLLDQLATETGGRVIDLSTITGLQPLYQQWDSAPSCVEAANIVAGAIKDVIVAFRSPTPSALQHIVLVGADPAIPHRRHKDSSGFADEKNFNPPVGSLTASGAGLRQDYVLSQDFYASFHPVTRLGGTLYVPEVGIGRLAETFEDIGGYLAAYFALPQDPATGNRLVVVNPTDGKRILSTGYTFIADLAEDLATRYASYGLAADRLIEAGNLPPTDPTAWSANDVRAKLFAPPANPASPQTYAVIALEAHYSANELLAANYTSVFGASEIAAVSDGRFRSSLFLSVGCHSGYNIVNQDGIAGVTKQPDWAQALTRQGATSVINTGYGYGDTEVIGYSESLLVELTKQLGFGTGPVPIGQAFLKAKANYIAPLATLSGVDEKALRELTLYGLPMLGWNFTAGRSPAPAAASEVTPTASNANGLSTADIAPTATIRRENRTLTVSGGTATVTESFFDADGNVQLLPFRPILPRRTVNVTQPDRVARGAALLSADYVDLAGFQPLVDVPATEVAVPHPNFLTPVFWPPRPWSVNTLVGQSLVTTPFQYLSDGLSPTGTARVFAAQTTGTTAANFTGSEAMTFRVYFTNRTDLAAATAGPPSILGTALSADGSKLRVDLTVGGPASADVEDVLVSFTTRSTAPQNTLFGHWRTCSLVAGKANACGGATQATLASSTIAFVRRYSGIVVDTATTGAAVTDVLLFGQAVNIFGDVAFDANNGFYYRFVPQAASAAAPKTPTSLTLTAPATTTFGSKVTLTATLAGAPAGSPVTFGLGFSTVRTTTVAGSVASVTIGVNLLPDTYQATVGFDEDDTHLGSTASAAIQVQQAPTALNPLGALQYSDRGAVLLLNAGSRNLNEQLVVITRSDGTSFGRLTDGGGRVVLDTLADGIGPGTLTISYAGDERYLGRSATVTILPESATVAFTSGPQPTGSVILTSQVTQEADGSPGDLTKAVVNYVLQPDTGGPATTVTAPVAADGSSGTTATLGPAVYTVTATVGGFFTSPAATALLAVFDPTVFVTGGGWVRTPDPASVTAPSPTVALPMGQKANFGFNAKYQSGTTIPTGSVLFQLQESSITFKATSFDWLVISGTHAELQGAGTINGAGSFGFRAIVDDLGPGPGTDKFELRIWDPAATPAGSFDQPKYRIVNTLGSPGGGNIIVH